MNLPVFQVNALIAGTQKGGTSALAHFLGQHPEVCLPNRKEAHFFDDYSDSPYRPDLSDSEIASLYQAYFPDYRGQKVVLDATPSYMYFPQVAERVYRYNPQMKWILLLRDPVERALSHYAMEYGRSFESLSLGRALLLEPWRLRRDRTKFHEGLRRYSYLDRGKYARQIRHILRFFPADQLCILSSQNLWEAHEETLEQVYAFLQISRPPQLPPRQRIFAGKKRKEYSVLRFFLRFYYLPEKIRMGYLARQLGQSKLL